MMLVSFITNYTIKHIFILHQTLTNSHFHLFFYCRAYKSWTQIDESKAIREILFLRLLTDWLRDWHMIQGFTSSQWNTERGSLSNFWESAFSPLFKHRNKIQSQSLFCWMLNQLHMMPGTGVTFSKGGHGVGLPPSWCLRNVAGSPRFSTSFKDHGS